MMKKCPFCGSPAVPWPDNASDYVRGYHLCEYHMLFVLKHSTRKTYDPKIVEDEDRRVMYEKAFYKAIVDCAKKFNANFEDEPNQDTILTGVYDLCVEHISPFTKTDYGEPVSETIDDALVDHWIAIRIKDLAKRGDHNKRCTGYKENHPDSRCANYTSSATGLCNECSKKKRQSVFEIGMFDALDKAMEIMRNA